MKEEIIRLKEEGKSYREIKKELGCSLGTIAYHLGKGQKEKALLRQSNRRASDASIKKADNFKGKLVRHKL